MNHELVFDYALFMSSISAIGSIATLFVVYVLFRSSQTTQRQLFVSNFETITNYIGKDEIRDIRGALYNSHEEIQELIKSYSEIKKLIRNYKGGIKWDGITPDEQTMILLNHRAKYLAAIYDRVCFLMLQDKKLRDKMIDYHGFTIGRLWKILEPLHVAWVKKDNLTAYESFEKMGQMASKSRHRKNIEGFIDDNYNKS